MWILKEVRERRHIAINILSLPGLFLSRTAEKTSGNGCIEGCEMSMTKLILDALKTGASSEDDRVRNSYTALKSILQNRFAEKEDSEGEFSLSRYEQKPEIWEAPLENSLAETDADKDEEIIKAAHTIIQGSHAGIVGDHAIVKGDIDIHHGDNIDADAGGDIAFSKGQASATVSKDKNIRAETFQGAVAENIENFTQNIGDKKAEPAVTLRIYRQLLIKTLQHLPLRGLDRDESDPSGNKNRLELDRVYVELDTKMMELRTKATIKNLLLLDVDDDDLLEHSETRSISTLEAAADNRHLVILGDPGSGKSTFVKHLTLCLATHDADNTEACLTERLACWPEDETDITPIPVILRDFARQMQDSEKAEVKHLWEFITERMKSQNLDFAEEAIKDALNRGKAIVLLDGLDEIPTQEKRTFVRDAVTAFARRYEKSRFIVTCRVLSYQNPEWKLDEKDFPVFELAPFDEQKIDVFIGAWYEDLLRLNVIKSTDERDILARRLKGAVRRPDLWRLAPNPLLLTVMALVHTHKGRLPDARALLYEETTDILLWRWEQVKTVGEKSLPRLQELLLEAERADVDLKKLLWRLAFEVHGKSESKGGELADIKEWELEKALAALHPKKSKDWAGQVIRTIKMRAGLLLEREPEVYSFPHRTFQEYLAGAHLSSQADFAKQASALVETGNFWREAVLLAVGRLVYLSGDSDKPLVLANELCPSKAEESETAWRKVWAAGEVLAEIGTNRIEDSSLGRELLQRVTERLVELLEKGRLEPKERVEAGNVLSRLGDPRFNPKMFHLPCGDDLGFVKIEAGSFIMGSDKERDRKTMDRELPQHEVKLSEYWIAKYPVTVAQFSAFKEDTGWQPAGEDWYRYNRFENNPVVEVSWNDAVKYCEWLTEKLKQKGYDWKIQLPTEAQWERAARGDDGRIYSWGDESDAEKFNCWKTGIGTTSPAGCFTEGNSPYGLSDISGNVWEWCSDWYSKYSSEPVTDPVGSEKGSLRVGRGGPWINPAEYCRSASRYFNSPDYRSYALGFRLSRGLHL
ncbi:MAG: SUMF1/EgtB/PvdO family nonheme iron enzyme [Desulfobacterales bacterium]|nr:SUMF1/EgtB/PvdO family nonheme iron enzyme [Desulfobacterales bacterium]